MTVVQHAMIVYLALNCNTPYQAQVEVIDGIAGRITCPECFGTGDWPFGEPEIPIHDCVPCTGTGKILVSV